jgi:hypothetical protein
VFALQGGMDRAALHAGVEPVLYDFAQWLDAGDGGRRSPARPHRRSERRIIGQLGTGGQPAPAVRQRAQLAELVAAHEARARDLAHGVARAQPHERLSVLEHLDPSATHRTGLPSKKLGR